MNRGAEASASEYGLPEYYPSNSFHFKAEMARPSALPANFL